MATKTKVSPFEEAMKSAAVLKKQLLALEGGHPRLSVSGWRKATAAMFPKTGSDEVARFREWIGKVTPGEHHDIQACLLVTRRDISNGKLRRPVSASGTKGASAYYRTLGGEAASQALSLLGFSFGALFWVAVERAMEMTPAAFGEIESWETYERDVQTLRDRLQALLTTPATMDDLQIDVRGDGSSTVSYKVTAGSIAYRPNDAGNTMSVVDYLMGVA